MTSVIKSDIIIFSPHEGVTANWWSNYDIPADIDASAALTRYAETAVTFLVDMTKDVRKKFTS